MLRLFLNWINSLRSLDPMWMPSIIQLIKVMLYCTTKMQGIWLNCIANRADLGPNSILCLCLNYCPPKKHSKKTCQTLECAKGKLSNVTDDFFFFFFDDKGLSSYLLRCYQTYFMVNVKAADTSHRYLRPNWFGRCILTWIFLYVNLQLLGCYKSGGDVLLWLKSTPTDKMKRRLLRGLLSEICIRLALFVVFL